MTNEQEQSITPAVISMRQKKGLAVATGNPLDKIELNPKEVDRKQVQNEQTLIERVVSLMQRRKRALQMKRSKPRIVRARNLKKTRLATQYQLMRRAMRMAKTMLRKRAAGARGANYSELSAAQKINIDRQIEPRTKNIKAMATRLMPRVKAGEMKRLSAVRTHKSTKGVYGNIQNLTQSYQPVIYSKLLGERVSKEDLNAMFTMYEGRFISAVTAPVRAAAKVAGAAIATGLALQTPQTAAAALAGAAGYGLKKMSEFGKTDPEKKNQKTGSDMDKINIATAKEKLAQQKLKTTAMKAGQPKQQPVNKSSSTVQASSPKQQPATANPVPVSSVPSVANKSPIIIPQSSRVRSQQTQQNLAPVAKTPEEERVEKQKLASKAARQQMGIRESFIVDRASGYSGVYTAKDLGIKMQGGFSLHPSVEEEVGAGFEGTNKLTDKYKNDTPGQAVEAFARMMIAKRKANTPC
jgi:hypothetical protein